MTHDYDIIKPLGRGGFGDVYLAAAKDTRRQVAVKFLRDLDASALLRFRREVRLPYEHIDNQFVVDVLAYDLDASPPCIVMEYCTGGSLRGWVTERRSSRVVAQALANAVQGLAGIHRAGGFHRDIKPDNLLLQKRHDGKWVVKVADFGLARVPLTMTGPMTRTAMGTEGHIAPELLMGGEYTQAADIYSLGITGKELLTGDKSRPILPSADVPIGLAALLNSMTEFFPAKRPDIAGISRSLYGIINDVPRVANTVIAQSRPPFPWKEVALGGLALLGMLAAGDNKEWDDNVKRYRGRDGRFKSD